MINTEKKSRKQVLLLEIEELQQNIASLRDEYGKLVQEKADLLGRKIIELNNLNNED